MYFRDPFLHHSIKGKNLREDCNECSIDSAFEVLWIRKFDFQGCHFFNVRNINIIFLTNLNRHSSKAAIQFSVFPEIKIFMKNFSYFRSRSNYYKHCECYKNRGSIYVINFLERMHWIQFCLCSVQSYTTAREIIARHYFL